MRECDPISKAMWDELLGRTEVGACCQVLLADIEKGKAHIRYRGPSEEARDDIYIVILYCPHCGRKLR